MDLLIDPFLTGNFAPVTEELDGADLIVTGTIPQALQGHYLRNGSNPAFAPRGRYHWFDGDGMIHAVHLEGGHASYRNRWVRTFGLQVEREAGSALFGGINNFVIPDDPDLFSRMGGPFKNVANTHVVEHAGKVLALWEGGFPHELDRDLDTIGLYDFDGRLEGAMTAHPKIDPVTGEMLFFGYSQLPPYLRFHVVDASGALVHSQEIDIPAGVMMHDFVITDRHAVFLDAPALFDLEAVLHGGPAIRWAPEQGCRIGVLPRDPSAGGITWHEVDPCFVFHFVNAWSDGDRLVVDAARHPRLSMPGDDPGTGAGAPTLARFTVDLNRGGATTEQLDDRAIEFPRIDERRTGLHARYGYSPSGPPGGTGVGVFDRLLKYDLDGSDVQEVVFGPGRGTGEAVFAPDPDGTAEDDGWLLAYVHDETTDQTELVIIDARDLPAGPVATVRLPARVPYGFHGSWMAAG